MKTSQHVTQTIEQKIQAGLQRIVGKTILHTAPHHDDILLGYFPYALRNIAGNTNHVLYVTSGANGVSDAYVAEHCALTQKDIELFDAATKQELKYRLRESESEKKWALCAGDSVQITHFRAEFYAQTDVQLCQQAMQRDIQRMVDYLMVVQPDSITILVDHADIGPSTHHRSQQVITAAIKQWGGNPTIFAYRNIWSSFLVEDATMIIPVTQAELEHVEAIFTDCFATQNKKFIFNDAVDVQGDALQNFAQQATYIQRMQLQQIKPLLGLHNQIQLAPIAGVIFLCQLTID